MSIDMNRVRVVIFLLLNLITASAFASADKYVASNNSEPYPALSGSSIILSGTTDDGNSSVYPIGFDFEFDQTTYNSFSASANGFIKLGNSGLSGANYTNNLNSTSTSNSPLIAAYWDDLMLSSSNSSEIRYEVSGTTGTRILKIEFYHLSLRGGSSNNPKPRGLYSFQIWLHEQDGTIEYYYNNISSKPSQESGSIGIAEPSECGALDAGFSMTNSDPANLEFPTSDTRIILNPDMMEVISHDVTHPSTADVSPAGTNNQMLLVNIQTLGANEPKTLSTLTFNTNGSTDALADISSARLYSTGNISTFNTSQQLGGSINNPSGSFAFGGISHELQAGNNYFWLVYDIKSTASLGNVVDAGHSSCLINGSASIPSTTEPTGSRTISGPMTYVSAEAFHAGQDVFEGSTDNQILRIEVTTSGAQNPLSVNSLSLSTSGSSNPSNDISQAKLFFTGSSPSFSASNSFGSSVYSPSGSFSFSGTQPLLSGTNYFWLVYEISSYAGIGNTVDAVVNSVSISSTSHTVANPDIANSNTIIELSHVWQGDKNNNPHDWFTKQNWQANSVPTASDNVLIPASVTNMPIIGAGQTAYCNNILIETGAQLSNSGTMNIAGTVTNNGNIQQGASATINVSGDFESEGNSVINSTVVFNGSAQQSITASHDLFFESIQLNKSGGQVNLETDISISNTLDMSSVNILLGNYDLTMESSASINNYSASSYIEASGSGMLKYEVDMVGNTFNFPIGCSSHYTPFELTLNSGTLSSATLGLNLTTSMHPMMIDASFLNRYWTVEPDGITGNIDYDVNFQYPDADVIGIEFELYPTKEHNGTLSQGGFILDINTNIAIWQGITSFSDFSLMNQRDDIPYPVEWLDFSANQINDKISLLWKTATESNSNYFVIEHATGNMAFKSIGQQKAAGSSSDIKTYSFIHHDASEGTNYYRIRQVDFDGSFDYSKTVQVQLNKQNEELLLYPNPISTGTRVNIVTGCNTQLLEIFSPDGRLIMHLETPQEKVSFYPNSKGVFIIRSIGSKFQYTRKLIVH